MPLAEIRDKFTTSEMAMISWRSQEQYWQMKHRMGPTGKQGNKTKPGRQKGNATDDNQKGGRVQYGDPVVDGLSDKWFNKDGELDLRQVTGEEAVRYMNARSQELGLPMFPMIGGTSRNRIGIDVAG